MQDILKKCLFIAVVTLLFTTLYSCGGKDEPTPINQNSGKVKVVLPSEIEVVRGGEITLDIKEGMVNTQDKILLQNDYKTYTCDITSSASDKFSFYVPTSVVSAIYKISLIKNDKTYAFGSFKLTIKSKISEIPMGATLYGIVESVDGNPIEGVVVTDGKNCTQTDSRGIYALNSEKSLGYVSISVPSGYEPETSGVFPQIYGMTVLSPKVLEEVSFRLKKVEGQDSFKVLFFGDQHLCNRSNDLKQYKVFCNDVNEYVAANAPKHIYAITLGDMTWDVNWKNGFAMPEYVAEINKNITDLIVYHTIGNHDDDPQGVGNAGAKQMMLTQIAPPWYSFNIGKAHFCVCDNIDCSKYDGSSRSYQGCFYGDQIEWLKNDLKYVDKSAPLFIMTHAPMYNHSTYDPKAYEPRGGLNYTDVFNLVKAFSDVHFVNAHTHQSHTVLPQDTKTEPFNCPVYEHNIAAVCAAWWYGGYYSGCNICCDGTPAGYAIFDFEGKNISWNYKGTSMDEKVQFMAFDLNKVNFSNYEWKKLTNDKVKDEFTKYQEEYDGIKHKNEVYVNVWNWNNDCKLTVKTTDGKELPVTQVRVYDPLSIMAVTIPHFDRNITSVPGTETGKRYHGFSIVCPDEDSDIVITFTDKFGRTYTENFERPHQFTISEYTNKYFR